MPKKQPGSSKNARRGADRERRVRDKIKPLYPPETYVGRSAGSKGPADLFVVKRDDAVAFVWTENNPNDLCFIARKPRFRDGMVQIATLEWAIGQKRIRYWQIKPDRAEAKREAREWASGEWWRRHGG